MMTTGPVKDRNFERCAEVREIWRAYRLAHPSAAQRGKIGGSSSDDSRRRKRSRSPRPTPAPPPEL